MDSAIFKFSTFLPFHKPKPQPFSLNPKTLTSRKTHKPRHCLWVLGHEGTLLRSDSIWKTLICNAIERHCSYNADEGKNLAEAMKDIKKELDQVDDLINKDSILFRCARWKVLFSDNFVKTFSNLPSTRTKKSVMNLLMKLSNGWRPKKIKTDPACDSSLQIVKQYRVEGRYVICTNDIMKLEGRYLQVLKIWDIVALDDVAKLVRRLDNIYGAFTDDFLIRCKEKSLEGDLEDPSSWSTSLDIVRFKSNNSLESNSASDGDLDVVNFAENSKVSESLLLMKFYALSAGTVGHLLSGADGKALDLPFEVTDEEKIIIGHSRSSFILGRSGTGKYTCNAPSRLEYYNTNSSNCSCKIKLYIVCVLLVNSNCENYRAFRGGDGWDLSDYHQLNKMSKC